MTSEQTQLINILKHFVNGEDAPLPKDADLKALTKLGIIHSLSSVVCYAINRQIIDGGFDDVENAKGLQCSLFKTVILQTERLDLFSKLLDVLNEHGIRVILMKGSIINRYYPDKMTRTFGDIDFLVDPERLEQLHDIMCKLGYEHRVAEKTVWTYVKGNENYEVHTALLPNREVLSDGMCKFIDYAFTATIPTHRKNIYELEPSYHFAFSLLHTAKHMRATGAGVRMYLDMALMIKNESNLNFVKVKEYTDMLGLSDFLDSALWLTNKWFGIKPPIDITAPSEDVFAMMEEYVISGGVFGFYDRNPAIARLRDEKLGRTKKPALLEYVFPSYKNMRETYKYLDGRPFLLPVVWIQRWFDGVLFRRKKAGKIFKGMFTEGKEAERTERMLQGIGIRKSIK